MLWLLTLFHMRLALLRHLYFEELCRLLWWCYKVNGWYVNYLRVFLYGIMEKLPVHRPLPLGGIADQRSSAGSDFTSFAFKVAFAKVYVTEMLEILENFLIFFGQKYLQFHSPVSLLRQTRFLCMYFYLFSIYFVCFCVFSSRISKQLTCNWHWYKFMLWINSVAARWPSYVLSFKTDCIRIGVKSLLRENIRWIVEGIPVVWCSSQV